MIVVAAARLTTRRRQRLALAGSLILLVGFVLTGCTVGDQAYHVEFLALGTTTSLTLYSSDAKTAAQAMAAAREEIATIGREWYPWSQDGELVRLNAELADGRAATVSLELARLLERAQTIAKLSDRTFDPGIGELVKAWGFDRADRQAIALPAKPFLDTWRRDPPSIADIRIHIGARNATIDSSRRDVLVDLGAIGKGYAVDRAIADLVAHGIHNALVDAGGNLRVIGTHDGRPWRIGIRDPRAVRSLAWLDLDNEAVATSGDYQRYAIVHGRRIHHLLDPRTGQPADRTIAVTVVANDATLADAAATALFVAGPDRWQATARALGVDRILRIDADGSIQVTKALAVRLQRPASETRSVSWTTVAL